MQYKNLQIWDGVGEAFTHGVIDVDGELFSEKSVDGEVQDMQGLYAIPGLIDAHVHMCLDPGLQDPLKQEKSGPEQVLAEMRERAGQMLRAGITSARDLGGGAYLELTLRDEIADWRTAHTATGWV